MKRVSESRELSQAESAFVDMVTRFIIEKLEFEPFSRRTPKGIKYRPELWREIDQYESKVLVTCGSIQQDTDKSFCYVDPESVFPQEGYGSIFYLYTALKLKEVGGTLTSDGMLNEGSSSKALWESLKRHGLAFIREAAGKPDRYELTLPANYKTLVAFAEQRARNIIATKSVDSMVEKIKARLKAHDI